MQIIKEIKAGNQDKLVEVYKLHRNEFIKWICNNHACSEDEAKDAFQEAIIIFYNNIQQGKITELRSGVKTYLFSIGRFKILNGIKKGQRLVTFDKVPLTNGMEPTENTIDDLHNEKHTQEVVTKYLDQQCEDCQKVLKMFYFEGQDMKSIAEKMGYKNSDVAKKKKYECFKKLAEMVKKNLLIFVF
ncbi:MAG: sigma-70 family RNA polymerase sigma factor [Bacteroidota bacterium]|nr:sigma-70 family RNA polymerase sigma factor [Bacteroidota bacterium]